MTSPSLVLADHSNGWCEELVDRYDKVGIRTLIQLLPFGIGSAIDAMMSKVIVENQRLRVREFFDVLNSGTTEITPEMIQDDQFLHCYFATIRAAIYTKRIEKVRWLAKLLESAISLPVEDRTGDDYDYLLKILDDLTHDEIQLLLRIRAEEIKHRGGTWTPTMTPRGNKAFWLDFRRQLAADLNISESKLDQRLVRIERTGCIWLTRPGGNELGPQYAVTTETFKELVEFAKISQG